MKLNDILPEPLVFPGDVVLVAGDVFDARDLVICRKEKKDNKTKIELFPFSMEIKHVNIEKEICDFLK